MEGASRGRYGKDTAVLFREAARPSSGSHIPAKSLELKHTIRLIQKLTAEIDESETAIKRSMDEEIYSPILTIPGISYHMCAMIIAEICDFSRFDSPDKILAYALHNAVKYVCHWDETFAVYLAKKRAEGKHYNVAISHSAKNLRE